MSDIQLFEEVSDPIVALPNSGVDLERLAMADDDVARLTRSEREQRVNELVAESHQILDAALDIEAHAKGLEVVGIVGLYSGGNDSTTLCHIMLDRITHLAHANTTIGIERTRQFVRDTAVLWGKPLLEFKPPRETDHYRALVLDHGFPGPGHHYKMFQRLKERAIHQVRRTLVTEPRKQRVFYLAGRRRTESKRRAQVTELERIGSAVWVSPMVNWTKLDLNTYRLMVGDVPTNDVTALLHMSGECLCGSFAHAGELSEIEMWFPDVVREIRALEAEIADRDDIPEHRRHWGWGAYGKGLPASKPSKSGLMCSSCDARWMQEELS